MRKKKDGNDESESGNSDEFGTRPGTKRRATAKPTAHERANSKNQTLQEVDSNGLNQTYDSDCIPISPQKRKLSSKSSSKSSGGVSWRGIKIASIEKLLEGTFGESSNGRIRVKLYAQKKKQQNESPATWLIQMHIGR